MINLNLGYPVSLNRYLRHAKGRTYRSKDAEQYRLHVASECLRARIDRPLAGLLELRLVLHPHMPANAAKRERKDGPNWWHEGVRCLDLDNAQKVALDAMQDHVYADDAQIRRIVMDYGYPVRGGGLTVEVRQWQQWRADALKEQA